MIRLSVTDLDNYLYWRGSEDQELNDLLIRLRGEEPPGPNMLASRAFHKMLERSSDGELFTANLDGFNFVFAIDEDIAVPQLRELKAEKVFETPSGPVTLVGKVDGLQGLTVNDWKLTERFEAERYADSYQWRSYLTMFNANRFVYDVFVCRYESGPATRANTDRVYVYDYHRLPFCAYPGMAQDVYREVCGLAEIVAKYVPQKIMPDEPMPDVFGPRKGPIRAESRRA